jgi:hypothetical protein
MTKLSGLFEELMLQNIQPHGRISFYYHVPHENLKNELNLHNHFHLQTVLNGKYRVICKSLVIGDVCASFVRAPYILAVVLGFTIYIK